MRDTGPVTQRPVELGDDELLVSRTDQRGVIVFANDAFVRVSGFSLPELIGQSHNLVRHPDMPPAAFADLWATLQGGQCWVGLVKNRCKNGDHYWVRATVSPFREAGRVTGYISVRTKPAAAEVAAAEAAYARIRDGDQDLAVNRGRVQRRGVAASIARAASSLRWRMAAGFALVALLMGGAVATGYHGLSSSRAAMESLHGERLVPSARLGSLALLLQDDWRLLAQAARAGGDAGAAARGLADSRTRAEALLAAYRAADPSPLHAEAVAGLTRLCERHRSGFVEPGLALLRAGRLAELAALVDGEGLAASGAAAHAAEELIARHERESGELVAGQRSRALVDTVAAAGFSAAALITAVVAAAGVITALSRRLGTLGGALEHLASGDRGGTIELGREDEVAPVLYSASALQTKITYAEASERESRQRTMAEFDRSIGGIVGELSGSISSMESTAQAQSAVAQQMSGNASGVAGAATELSASIKEIAGQAHRVSELARQAVDTAQRSQTTMESLTRAANEITGVAKLITDIAEQTNLLALNATIEAARAGEVGRGFAVVAGEVKSLAGQTRGATGDIGQRIAAVQADAKAAVEALAGVGASIGALTDAAHAIAAAVEEQAAVVDEVARNAEQAATAAGETGSMARSVASASTALSASERSLRDAVARFKGGLGAAA